MTAEQKQEKVEATEAAISNPPWDEVYYTHWTKRLTYSCGMRNLAEVAGAHWLVDLVASHQLNRRVRAEEFQLWILKRTVGNRATITCQRDKDAPVICRQNIEYTDFPLDTVTLYVENGMLLLPSER